MPHLIETIDALEARGVGFRSLTESIDITTPGGRLVFNQVIDAHGALRLHAQALFLQLRDLHADIGTHQIHCRLQDAHGDIIDEQTQSIVQAPGQTLLLGICYFPLHRDLVTGLWHYDIDLDDAPVADDHLIMRP